MHDMVLIVLGAAVLLSGSAVAQMLLAPRTIRSSAEWGAIFFPSGAFLVMSFVIYVDVGSRTVHPIGEYALVAATVVLALGAALGVRSLLRSMVEQQARDDELTSLRIRYERLFKANDMPIVVFDSGSLAIVDVNDSGEELFGRTRGELLSASFDSLDFEQDARAELALADSEGRGQVELRRRTPGGEVRNLVVHLSVGEVAGVRLWYGICEDVTERNAARAELLAQQQQLAHLADHDALTGLPNRRVLDTVLARALARAEREVPSALLFIDVDDFKQMSDVHGHQAGDAALTAIARLLEAGVRAGDVVVRIGGDEFAVLLEGIELMAAAGIARRLVVTVRERYADLGLSVGVVPVVASADMVEVVRRADECMYAAKAAGGNRAMVKAAPPVCVEG